MTKDEAFSLFSKCVIEVLEVNPEDVHPGARFGEDLDADSLDLVELGLAVEEALQVSVPEDEMKEIRTVGQAFDLVAARL